MQEKKRLNYIDGIRFFAVLLVVLDHFNASLARYNIAINGNQYIFPSNFTNLAFGTLGVSLFFIISGVSLYYNYENDFNIQTYFKKRFLNIYPQFWCSYILVFLILFLKYKEFRFEITENIPTSRFILTVLGMDGYFLYQGRNFYLIGEWFLGCIIFLYLLFPVLRICVKKHPLVTWAIAIIIYLLVALYNPFEISITRNLLIRGYDFLFGMLIARYIPTDIDSKAKLVFLVVFGILFVVGTTYPVARLQICMITLAGVSLFLFCLFMFEKINLGKLYFVKIINKYSYDIFLLHHVTLSLCFEHFRDKQYSLFEGATLAIIYIISLGIFIKVGSVTKNAIIQYIQKQKTFFEI